MKEIVNIMKALGEENRFRIVMMLRERPLCVCEICSVLDISISTVSSHLKQLAYAGLVEGEKDGRWVTYRLVEEKLLLELLGKIRSLVKDGGQLQKDKACVLKIDPESCSTKIRNGQKEKG